MAVSTQYGQAPWAVHRVFWCGLNKPVISTSTPSLTRSGWWSSMLGPYHKKAMLPPSSYPCYFAMWFCRYSHFPSLNLVGLGIWQKKGSKRNSKIALNIRLCPPFGNLSNTHMNKHKVTWWVKRDTWTHQAHITPGRSQTQRYSAVLQI
jgi:hypothetical protein